MFRLIGALGAVLLLAAPASAQQFDFTGITCEDDRTIEIIAESVAGLQFSDGRRVAMEGSIKVASSKTVSVARNRLTCAVQLRISVQGDTETIRGRFMVEAYPDGRMMSSFDPYY